MRRLRSTMQEECAPVVSETSPRLQHICSLRSRERTERWESLQEPLSKLIHSRNLRLLRHHLNNEHFIRFVPFTDLEGASVRLVPGEQELVDALDLAGGERHGWRAP